MGKAIGVMAAHQIAVGVVENGAPAGPMFLYPESESAAHVLEGMPAENLAECLSHQIKGARQGAEIEAVGVGLPGIIHEGVVEESPNLPQFKGFKLQEALASALETAQLRARVCIFNDADAIAAGLAATQSGLDQLIRIWLLGHGIGYGRYPWTDGVWEGGHTVVTLDANERFCGCGGRGHLEGVMGQRAMRMRFLDMEPDEVFAGAKAGNRRCAEFVQLFHRALAAATATSIAMEGPGKFFITGPGSKFVDLGRLGIYLHEMVKLSPLQGSQLEVIGTDFETGIIGAAVNATRAAGKG